MRCYYLLISLLVLSSLSVGHGSKPTFLKKQPGKKVVEAVVDIPRGGGSPFPAGPFSADVAQKVFVGSFGVNAALCAISPTLAASLYGMKGGPDAKRIMQDVGKVGMNTALLLYLQVFNGMSHEKAIGWSVWPFLIISFYQAVIAKNDHLIDHPTVNHILPSVNNLLVFFASQAQASWAGSLNLFYGYFSLINGFPMYFFPKVAAKVWQVSLKSDEAKFMFENLGYFLLAHGTSVLIGGSSGTADAIGWTALAVCASLIGLLVRGELKIVKQEPVYPWIFLLAAIANSLLST